MFNPAMIVFALLVPVPALYWMFGGIFWGLRVARAELYGCKRLMPRVVEHVAMVVTIGALLYAHAFLFAFSLRSEVAIFTSLWWLIIVVPVLSCGRHLSLLIFSFISSGIFLLMVLMLSVAIDMQREVDEAVQSQAVGQSHQR